MKRREHMALLAGMMAPQIEGAAMGNPVVHFEIGFKDKKKTGQFYADVFGWKLAEAGPATNIDTASGGKGIPGHMTELGHEPHQYTLFYIEVPDIKVTLEQVVALGGKKLVGPIPIPTGTFAWVKDPEGNTVGLLQR